MKKRKVGRPRNSELVKEAAMRGRLLQQLGKGLGTLKPQIIKCGNANTNEGIRDEDLAVVKKTIERQDQRQQPIKLDSLTIKTLSVADLSILIDERQGELKELKIELVSRII